MADLRDGRIGSMCVRGARRGERGWIGRGVIGVALLTSQAVLLTGCWSFKSARGSRLAAGGPSPVRQFSPGSEGVSAGVTGTNFSFTPRRSYGQLLPEGAWPSRDPEAVRPIFEQTPEVVAQWKIRDGFRIDDLNDDDRRLVETPALRVVYKGMHANGLLRVVDGGSEDPFDSMFNGLSANPYQVYVNNGKMIVARSSPGFEANAWMMSSRTLAGERASIERERLLRPPNPFPPEEFELAGAGKGPPPPPPPPPKIQLVSGKDSIRLSAGKPVRVPPAREGGEPYKGVLIHLQSTGPNAFEPKTLDEFKKRGWAIFDLSTETDVFTPIPAEWAREVYENRRTLWELDHQIRGSIPGFSSFSSRHQRWYREHPLYERYVALWKRTETLARGSFQACTPEQAEEVGKELAGLIDDAIAGSAYSVQAMIEYIDAARPDLQGLPLVVAGFSAGALVAPAAVTRVRERVDAVVLIGGGSNLFHISQKSVFKNGGVIVRCGEEPVSAQIDHVVNDAYLKHAKLDPIRTAEFLRDMPVLQVHAKYDTWVPAVGGEALYEALGRPDRLTIGAGHPLLFYRLPGQAGWIADWVEKTVRETPARSGAGMRTVAGNGAAGRAPVRANPVVR